MSTKYFDFGYHALAEEVLERGASRGDRTGTGTKSLFGKSLHFDISEFFPLVTTKQVYFKTMARELLWMLSGSTNIRPLVLQNVSIWSEWPFVRYLEQTGQKVPQEGSEEWKEKLKAFENKIRESEYFAYELGHGELGPVYGSGWRHWNVGHDTEIDQVARVVHDIKNNPYSRSHLVNAWNASDYEWLRTNSLPPCHYSWQCYVAEGKLSLLVNQRSCDMFLGVPFNIASYALLCYMLAHVTRLKPGELIWNGGDVHIYNNHIEQMKLQLARVPLPSPKLEIVGEVDDINSFTIDNFRVIDYKYHPAISAPIAV